MKCRASTNSLEGIGGQQPQHWRVIVLPDLAAAALYGLLHEAEFYFVHGIEFIANANEGTVLIEVIADDVFSEVEEDFIGKDEVSFFRFGERDGGTYRVSQSVFVAPVGHVPIASGVFHFADPALFEADAVRPVEASPFCSVGDLLPEAMLGEVVQRGKIAVAKCFYVGIPCRQHCCISQVVVDAGAHKPLLPIFAEVRAADLPFEVETPITSFDAVIACVVEPEVAVGVVLVSVARLREGDGAEEWNDIFHGIDSVRFRRA